VEEERIMGADHDAVVVGAGFAGLYAVHKLRDDLGLNVQGFDAAGGPGGTWWWNRYPGARCDFESVHYSYSFSDDLQREWEWTERFAAQPEILSYLEWVADRLDVRRAFRFHRRVTSLVWDEAQTHWTVGTDDGATCTARFVVAGPGNLSVAKAPDFPGLEDFGGEVYRTSAWPHEPVDFRGKRVGVIGTGSTGIQVIPEIARQAAHLTVFQRTANFAAPLRNEALEPAERRRLAENHAEVRAGSRENFLGVPYEAPQPSAVAATPEERRRVYDEFWEKGGFRLVVSTFQDLLFDKRANDTIADYIRERIRERVTDPATAELLCPDDHPYATKRAPFETDYYETFNRENVSLVDVRSAPIETLTETGLRTEQAEYELDVVVLATGFDAMTGPLLHMGITGRDGLTLNEKWVAGPVSYLGIMTGGFPNLFTLTGPQSAVALYNNPLAIEDHVEFTAQAITYLRERDAATIEPTAEAEQAWGALTEGVLHMTLLPEARNSWYMGANIAGKPRAAFIFAGGAPLYLAITEEIKRTGFAGFALDGAGTPIPPMVEVDPAVALVLGALLIQGAKPLEECTLEETRAAVESFTLLQSPPRDVRVVTTSYPGPADERPARIYTPDREGPLPVVVFFHPGGWVGGSLDVSDEPCRTLADDLGAIVVSAGYRLAPEAPFPAATDDTYAALRWVAETIADHGGDPDRIVVMGESAGANLAAVAALRARDEGGPQLVGQVLLYPPIDPQAQTPSRERYAAGPFLSAAAADGMWAAYLGDPGNASSPLASPARAADLSGLPPTLILTAECDPTRDEAEDFGRALSAAGVPTDTRRIAGMIHGAFNMSGLVPRSREFYDAVGEFLQSNDRTPA
jgi:cation diffusion facilitator CzcD-associated flavoprotein CzcO/acetyl esterase/lipase